MKIGEFLQRKIPLTSLFFLSKMLRWNMRDSSSSDLANHWFVLSILIMQSNPMGSRMMLPSSVAIEGGPIFVNAKQYNAIMRRRRCRAKAESKNQEMKTRKPYMHLSRHLHAVRRHRGVGGRFLSAKGSNTDEKTRATKQQANHVHPQPTTESQMSEVLESDGGHRSTKTSSGSEVTSYLHHFEFDLLQPSFPPYMASNYLKV
ncbi:hypothetical protein SASPL_155124 [Salvia splendens]|uniref:Nuclear transcription factor Y subunit n=1 Tax=Salvia splendens TaxID=180675 RepID=A0A8X8YZ24_SALSN|nr:hypothetical protein SASPL_155124 [Salvia splendens]